MSNASDEVRAVGDRLMVALGEIMDELEKKEVPLASGYAALITAFASVVAATIKATDLMGGEATGRAVLAKFHEQIDAFYEDMA